MPPLCASMLIGDKEVRGLREEVSSVKSELKEVREENVRLKSQIEQQLEVRKVTGRSASMWAIKNRVLGSSQRG